MKKYTLGDGRELVVRIAEQDDMAEAVETFRSVASEMIYLDTEEVPPETVDVWKDRWKENGKDILFILSLVEGKIIGGLVLTPYSRSKKSTHVRTLGMWLLKDYRRLKVGSSLIDYAIEWSRSRNIRKIHLGVYSSNYGAIKLYLEKGFTIEGSLKNSAFVGGDFVDEISMGLDL